MAVSRTAAATVPLELQRQAGRVGEQVERLGVILNTITSHLEEISVMMKDYNPDLVSQTNNLKNTLESYKVKSNNIYGEIATTLSNYAMSLIGNLQDLTTNVSKISSSVDAL